MTAYEPYSPGAAGPPAGPVPHPPSRGPVGQVRSTGLGIFLFFITLGIYSWYWYFVTHDDMKRHSGEGLGGGLALVIAVVVGVASPFLTGDEVGKLYQRAGRHAPVSALTGLWVMPGILLIFLPIVWFVKTNGALNEYWRSMGARG